MLTSHSMPVTRNLVLIGGGHAHALLLRAWAMNPLPGVQVTLINPYVKAPYTGMLPGFIAGHYNRDELNIDLVKLARRAGAHLVTDYAVGIDLTLKRVLLSNSPYITYDTLSLDIGITTKLCAVSGAAINTVSVKPLDAFANAWELLLNRINQEGFNPKIAVIGGGVAGVELSLAMAHRLQTMGTPAPDITLIETDTEIVRKITPAARRILRGELSRYKTKILTNAHINQITQTDIYFKSDITPIPTNFVVAAAGATPHPWLAETKLALHNGYIKVDEMLRSVNIPHVFAAGDCNHLTFAPRPKAGVFAVQQAPILFKNLRADLSSQKMTRYHPQNSYLKLISLGQKSALADKWGITFKGKWVWRLKDHIDHSFMLSF